MSIQVVFECCTKLENRRPGPGPRDWEGMEGLQGRPDITVTHCRVCESRHVEAYAEPGRLGLKGASL